ncbi:MAG: aminotransferase class I/II-fold pyridoxal phosphate-dependent enzyme [Planctomycetaceae bacterium]
MNDQAHSESENFPLIDEAYSHQLFGELSAVWQSVLTDHLKRMQNRETPVLSCVDPHEAVREAESFLKSSASSSADRRGQFADLLGQMLAHSQNLHHPGYIGHQVPASVPIAGLFDAVGSVTNQPMAIFEMGPWATAVEHAIVRQLCGRIGWDADNASGILTHGGSLANLTALLTARNVVFPDSWENGTPSDAVLIAQSDAHYCIARSAGILGLGTRSIVRAELDSRRRMDPERLENSIQQLKASGRRIMAVAASACATPIGAFDPLTEIAAVCRQHGIWLHVDAAHGGGALMSQRHRHLLKGIEQADSVVWDAHKMLFMPALCAAVLYKNRSNRFATFHQDAPYLFDPSSPGMAEFDGGTRTIECTKRSAGFGLWGLWSMFGADVFAQLVNRTFALAAFVYQQVESAADFSACHIPECNIVVFRYLPPHIANQPLEIQNEFQRHVRRQLVHSGKFYIVQTTLDGVQALRLTVMNPLTTESDLIRLLNTIREQNLLP